MIRSKRTGMTVGAVTVVASLLAVGLAMLIRMPGRSFTGALAPLSVEQASLRNRLIAHVSHLAGTIGERNLSRPAGLRLASDYLRETWTGLGLAVDVQAFEVAGRLVENVAAEVPSVSLTAEIVVVGAHYDSVTGCPGANDNATGVAALLEIARYFATRAPHRSLRLVGFVNEEPPYFQTPDMGSLQYARRSRARGERISAMLSLETLGAYSDEPGSQEYPLPLFGRFYPDTASFVAFVGNVGSRRLVRQAIGTFRRHAAFPSEGAAVPGWVPGVGWSDHWAFWREGYPAIMVTDTALYRYPHYHTIADTPDKVDYARVVSGLVAVVDDLTGGT